MENLQQKKAKTIPSAGKVMPTFFWDSQGIIFTHYLEKCKTITGEYYSLLLGRLRTGVHEKRPELANKKVLFHHKASVPNRSRSPIFYRLGSVTLLFVPRYEADGKRCHSNEEMTGETNGDFTHFDKS